LFEYTEDGGCQSYFQTVHSELSKSRLRTIFYWISQRNLIKCLSQWTKYFLYDVLFTVIIA